MATATALSIEEYLRTSYKPDCDYVDGQLKDRNVGQRDHSYLQAALSAYLFSLRRKLGCNVFTEQRIRVSKSRVRLPDLCLQLGPYPSERVFQEPPFLCIEILSPEDRMTRIQRKLREYFDFGVKYVWVIDPEERRGWIHTATESHEAMDGILRTSDPEILLPLADVLPEITNA